MIEKEMDGSSSPLSTGVFPTSYNPHPAIARVLSKLHTGLYPLLIGDPNQQISRSATGCVVGLVILCGQQEEKFCSTGDRLLQLLPNLPDYWHHADQQILDEIRSLFDEFASMIEFRLAPKSAIN